MHNMQTYIAYSLWVNFPLRSATPVSNTLTWCGVSHCQSDQTENILNYFYLIAAETYDSLPPPHRDIYNKNKYVKYVQSLSLPLSLSGKSNAQSRNLVILGPFLVWNAINQIERAPHSIETRDARQFGFDRSLCMCVFAPWSITTTITASATITITITRRRWQAIAKLKCQKRCRP